MVQFVVVLLHFLHLLLQFFRPNQDCIALTVIMLLLYFLMKSETFLPLVHCFCYHHLLGLVVACCCPKNYSLLFVVVALTGGRSTIPTRKGDEDVSSGCSETIVPCGTRLTWHAADFLLLLLLSLLLVVVFFLLLLLLLPLLTLLSWPLSTQPTIELPIRNCTSSFVCKSFHYNNKITSIMIPDEDRTLFSYTYH